jgi:hypothetical protein
MCVYSMLTCWHADMLTLHTDRGWLLWRCYLDVYL